MTTAIIIFIYVLLLTSVYAGWRGAPWVPTRKKDVERFLKLAEIKSGQKMYDLGCGDGRLLCAAAKAGANAQGYELSLFPFILAHIRRLFRKERSRIKISYRDVWNTNLSDADVVYFFLMPKVYPKLKEKFERELKKGAKVIAYVWPIQEWTPLKVDTSDHRSNIYLYQL